MTSESSVWRAVDPEAPEESFTAVLPPEGEMEGGRIVVLRVARSVRSDGWAGRVAMGLARAWAFRGERVVVADLAFDEPELHALFGLENGEGMTDALLFGASIRRVAQPQDGGAFDLVPAGTPTGDPAQALGHRRWQDILDGFQKAGVTLLAFLPDDLPGSEDFATRATHTLLLSTREDWDRRRSEVGEGGARLPSVVLGPPASVAPSEPAGEGSPPSAEPTAPASEPPAGSSGAAPLKPRPKAVKRRRSPWLLLLLLSILLAAAGLIAAAWLGYLEIPGLWFAWSAPGSSDLLRGAG